MMEDSNNQEKNHVDHESVIPSNSHFVEELNKEDANYIAWEHQDKP